MASSWAAILLLLLFSGFFISPSLAQSNNSSSSQNNMYANFNPSTAIVIVVLIGAFLFLAFFSVYIRNCSGESNSVVGRNLPAGMLARSRRQRGLDKSILETFPTLVYSEVKDLNLSKGGALECAVCLNEFEDDEKLRLLPTCKHAFHPECVDAWLESHITCPVCRANLSETTQDSESVDPETVTETPARDAVREETCGDQLTPPQVQGLEHVINIESEKTDEERVEMEKIRRQRSSRRPQKFPRSHSTGHSLVQRGGEKLDRYTLRLPDHIHQEVVLAAATAGKRLQRTKSSPPANSGEGSTRRGRSVRRWRSFGIGRSDRWPSFLLRSFSISTRGSRRGNGDGENSVKKVNGVDEEGSIKKVNGGGGDGSVKGKFLDCVGGNSAAIKSDGATNESPSASFARV